MTPRPVHDGRPGRGVLRLRGSCYCSYIRPVSGAGYPFDGIEQCLTIYRFAAETTFPPRLRALRRTGSSSAHRHGDQRHHQRAFTQLDSGRAGHRHVEQHTGARLLVHGFQEDAVTDS